MAATAKTQIGAPGRVAPNVYSMASAPTVDNDASDGIRIGDYAINTGSSPDSVYFCVDNTEGAAVWRQVTFV